MPVASLGEAVAAPSVKPWGHAIGAALLVCVCTLIGVAFFAPGLKNLADRHQRTVTATVIAARLAHANWPP